MQRPEGSLPTFNGCYTSWKSFSAASYKIDLVRSLTNRVLRIHAPSNIYEQGKTLGKIVSKMVTLAISWRSWLREIFLDVALVLDFVRLFFKYRHWNENGPIGKKREQCSPFSVLCWSCLPSVRTELHVPSTCRKIV